MVPTLAGLAGEACALHALTLVPYYRLMAKRVVRFTATRTVRKPATVKFKTKSGKTVSFRAIKTFKKRQAVKFRAKQ